MPALVRIREDVHVHASAQAVLQRVLDLSTYDEWLAPAFRDYRADDEGCSFDLVLPGRVEHARLRRGGVEAGAFSLVRDGANASGAGALDSIVWAMHSESAREVHLTAEMAYVPAGGFGAILETTVHRPNRTQALRDSLWALKQLLESAAGEARATRA